MEQNNVYGDNIAGDKHEHHHEAPHSVPQVLIKQVGLANNINFVGRKEDLEKIDEFLNQDSMLLLLNGIEGIEKSTLASYYLNQKKDKFDHYGFIQVNDNIGIFLVKFKKYISIFCESVFKIIFNFNIINHFVFDLLVSYGKLQNNIGFYYKGLLRLQQALSMTKILLINEDNMINFHSLLGLTYKGIYNYKDAYTHYTNVLENQIKVYGENNLTTITLYQNIGNLFMVVKKYRESLIIYNRILILYGKIENQNYLMWGILYGHLGLLHSYLHKFGKSLCFHRKSLNRLRRLNLPIHSYIAMSFTNIGYLYKSLEKYEKVHKYYFKVLEIRTSILEHTHPKVAESCHNVATCYFQEGKYSNAHNYLEKVINIWEHTFPSNYPQVIHKKKELILIKNECLK